MNRDGRAEFFRISLLLSLGIGLVIADLRFDRRAALVLFGFYLVAALLQRWIMAGRSYDARAIARREARKLEESEALFYCGASLESEKADDEKTAVLEILSPRRAFYRRAARYGLVALFVAISIRYRFDFRVSDALFVAGAIVIVIAATTGHLLLALGLNALVVLPSILTLSSGNLPVAFLYLFSIFLTFAAHQFYESGRADDEDPAEWFADQRRKLIRQSAILAAGFCLVGLVVDRLIPDPKPVESGGDVVVERALEVNRALGKRFRTAPAAPRAVRGGEPPAIDENTDAPASRISPEEARRMAIALGKLLPRLERTRGNGPQEGAPSGNGEIPKLPSPNPETLARLQAEFDRARVERGKSPEEIDRTKREEGTLPLEEAKKILESLPNPKEGDHSKDAQFARELAKAIGEAERRGSGEVNVAREIAKAPAAGSGAAEPSTKPIPPREPPLISEEALKRLFKLVKFLAYLGAVIAAALFAKKLLAKNDPAELATETRRRATPTERSRLLAEIRRIESARLSESEEVVARYRVFLELMRCLNFAKPDSLPPHEYAAFLRTTFPKLEFPLSVVTEGFCDVYYGDWKLGAARLREFKSQHSTLFRKLL